MRTHSSNPRPMRVSLRPKADDQTRSDVVEVPENQAVIARARELRAGGLSLRAVGRALAQSGHRPRGGSRWHVQVLARMTAE